MRPADLGILAFGSIGVVFGDIGTSPLYALQTALGQLSSQGIGPTQVIGVVSLIVWALLIVVTAKYVLFLMFADNKGEGGILSLTALAQIALGKRTVIVFLIGVAGAALFSGDAIITPAISVLSALEGLKQVDAELAPFVLPATVVILILLFLAESRGTAGVATFFAPIMAVFFVAIGVLGVASIVRAPDVLQALSPIPGVTFLFHHGSIGFVVLGSVFLAVTGAEALYADMGHFGRRPIQTAWLSLVLPALLLNYLGQGALLLRDPQAVENPFYLLAPSWSVLPLVILSTAATVIASQAVITGAFSLVARRSSSAFCLVSRSCTRPTRQEGQIYIPRVNLLLLLGVLALVLLFRSSGALANAYGIAVSGTMVTTTALAFFVVWQLWRWPLWGALAADLHVPAHRHQLLHRQPLQGARRRLGAADARLGDVHRDVDLAARQCAALAEDRTRLDPDCGSDQDAGEVEAGAGAGNGGVSDQRSDASRRPRSCTTSSTTRSCTSAW